MTLISFLVLLGVSWLGLYAVLGSEKQLTIFTRTRRRGPKLQYHGLKSAYDIHRTLSHIAIYVPGGIRHLQSRLTE